MDSIVVPPRESKRNSITMDGAMHGLRLRVEYPDILEKHGRDRILAVLGEAITKLDELAARSDPSSMQFEMPGR